MSRQLAQDADIRAAYARDASGLERIPESVARPTELREVAEIIAEAASAGRPVTAAGGQTSTTGASITDVGTLLSLRGLERIGPIDADRGVVRAEAGVRLGELKRTCAAAGWLLAPDPTSEDDCTIGGAIGCNASGARSLAYGAMRPHVAALEVVMADGRQERYVRSRIEKNTAGYAAVQDPVDWFIGSEGTLGVIVEAELSLLPLPERVTGIALPFARVGFMIFQRHQKAQGHFKHRRNFAFLGSDRKTRAHQRHHRDHLIGGAREIAVKKPQWFNKFGAQSGFFLRLAQRCGHRVFIIRINAAAGKGHLSAMA